MDRRLCTVFGAAIGFAVTPIVAPLLVGAVGFGAAGPVAGTLAPMLQASIGNVVAGSAFAVAQSIGMGGAIPIGISVIGAAIGGTAGAAAGGGSDNLRDEDDADAGTAGEDGAPPAAADGSSGPSESGARTASEEDSAHPVTASPTFTESGESMAGATNADGDGAHVDDPTPVGVDAPRTGLDRCKRCKRKHRRYCWHR